MKLLQKLQAYFSINRVLPFKVSAAPARGDPDEYVFAIKQLWVTPEVYYEIGNM